MIRGSIVVSISACHAEDPGAIPGCGVWGLAVMVVGWVRESGGTTTDFTLRVATRAVPSVAKHSVKKSTCIHSSGSSLCARMSTIVMQHVSRAQLS